MMKVELGKNVRVALVHDYFTQRGGAERVAEMLHAAFPSAPVFTTILDRRVLSGALLTADLRTSRLQHWPGVLRALPLYAPLLPYAVEGLDLRGFDLVISSSSTVAHGVQVPDGVHVAYVYNTMRFAWDYESYIRDYPLPAVGKWAGRYWAKRLRNWDRMVAGRAQAIVPISGIVASRIRQHWRVEPLAPVHPPADLAGYRLNTGPRRHFAAISRLLPYKRVDVAIVAANLLKATLLVVGDGPDRPRLERLAGPTVQFLGRISDADKRVVLERAVAVVVAGAEDYGLVPVEANACGTPVVAWNQGGVPESQIQGVTALLVEDSTPEAFAQAMSQAAELSWDRAAIRSIALQRDSNAFMRSFEVVVRRALGSQNETVPGMEAIVKDARRPGA